MLEINPIVSQWHEYENVLKTVTQKIELLCRGVTSISKVMNNEDSKFSKVEAEVKF